MTLAQARAYAQAAGAIERRRLRDMAIAMRGAQADEQGWGKLMAWLDG